MALTESKLKALMNLGHSESEIRRVYSEVENQPLGKEPSLEELRAFGIDVDGELVITVGQPRRKS